MLRFDTEGGFCLLLFLTLLSQAALVFDKMMSEIDQKSPFIAITLRAHLRTGYKS